MKRYVPLRSLDPFSVVKRSTLIQLQFLVDKIHFRRKSSPQLLCNFSENFEQYLGPNISKIQDLAGKTVQKCKILPVNFEIRNVVGTMLKIQGLADKIWRIKVLTSKIKKIQILQDF